MPYYNDKQRSISLISEMSNLKYKLVGRYFLKNLPPIKKKKKNLIHVDMYIPTCN